MPSQQQFLPGETPSKYYLALLLIRSCKHTFFRVPFGTTVHSPETETLAFSLRATCLVMIPSHGTGSWLLHASGTPVVQQPTVRGETEAITPQRRSPHAPFATTTVVLLSMYLLSAPPKHITGFRNFSTNYYPPPAPFVHRTDRSSRPKNTGKEKCSANN